MTAPGNASPLRATYPDARVLVVDDNRANLALLEALLTRSGYSHVLLLDDPREVLAQIPLFRPDIVLLDMSMPFLNGVEVLKRMPRIQEGHLPVVMITAHNDIDTKRQALEAGADDFVTKPFDSTELLLRVNNLLRSRTLQQNLRRHNRQLEERVADRTRELEGALLKVTQSREEALFTIGLTLEYRDYETKGHTERVTRLAVSLGKKLLFNEIQLTHLKWGAYLHDIGKIAIPDAILLKPEKLTAEEFSAIKKHSVIGEKMLQGVGFLPAEVLEVVRHHHERFDGCGYPDRLSSHAIPLLARVFSVVDVYNALLSERPYKAAWSHDAAAEELLSLKRAHFDPNIVEAFLELDVRDLYRPCERSTAASST